VSSRDPWKVHGYVFSACFGVFAVALVWLFAKLLDIPTGVPLNQALTPGKQVVFVLLLGVSAALAYLLARLASLAVGALLDALKRK
jgi:hypothetical protein